MSVKKLKILVNPGSVSIKLELIIACAQKTMSCHKMVDSAKIIEWAHASGLVNLEIFDIQFSNIINLYGISYFIKVFEIIDPTTFPQTPVETLSNSRQLKKLAAARQIWLKHGDHRVSPALLVMPKLSIVRMSAKALVI